MSNTAPEKLDISSLVSLKSIGWQAWHNCNQLRDIQLGSVDWSTIVTDLLFNYAPNDSTCILRADSQAVADAFKAKVPASSNWTVVIN